MAFGERFLDELRTRISLVELVGRRVKLVRRGKEHTGLCPFHNEKTASFTVSDAKGFYHCFGCQAHGSAFDFVMQSEGLSFPEAVEKLAREAGMEVPRATPEARAVEEARAGLHELLEQAAQWFQSQLLTTAGARALAYLRGRGLDDASIQRFRLGYAPDHRAMLKQALEARGFGLAAQLEAGMLVAPEGGGEPYDRFRDRVTFPIADRRGRTIAFGARAMADVKPKYLNSPDTPLFHKGRSLYNLADARAAAHDAGTVIAAEGYMDVIALCRAGLGHAVAPLGTALTEEQLGELWRMAAEPILCFDGDEAGRRAAHRAAERALPLLKPGFSLRFVELPPGQDPDSLLQGRGAAALRALFESTTPLVELLWRRAAEGRTLDTPERRAGFRKDLGALAQTIGDPAVREYYGREFHGRLDRLFAAPRKAAFAARGRGRGRAQFLDQPLPPRLGLAADQAGRARERLVLALVLNHPELLEGALEELNALEFQASDLDRLRCAILEDAGLGGGLDLARLKQHFTGDALSKLLDDLTGPKASTLAPFARPGAPLDEARKGWTFVLGLHRLSEVEAEIRDAQAALEAEWTDAAWMRLQAAQAERERARRLAAPDERDM
jgi:DNA primase